MNKLAKLSGLTTRTLRYYDEIGLLKPARVTASKYRIYGQKQVDTLQQILFYRELGFPLEHIKLALSSPDFDQEKAFCFHLQSLEEKRAQLDALISNVKQSMSALKGEQSMSDTEKFEGFKEKRLAENEKQYGQELRERFGHAMIDQSNAKVQAMPLAQYEDAQELLQNINESLKQAQAEGGPAGAIAQNACALHKQWLAKHWPNYTREMHLGLATMYVDDPRFRAYYDDISPGLAQFFHDALVIYCQN